MADRAATSAPRGSARREQILDAAAALVAERGYHDVGMAEIGAAAGVTGPAIYRHFEGKSAVLVTMFDRVIDELSADALQIAADVSDPVAALDALIATQVRFVLRDRTLAQVYHNEIANLPTDDRNRLRRKQRRYIEEWVQVLGQVHRGETDADLRTRVHAAIGAVQSVLFFHSGLSARRLDVLLRAVAGSVLFADA